MFASALLLLLVGGLVEALGVGVVSEVVRQYLSNCYLLLVDFGSQDFSEVLRGVQGSSQVGVVILDAHEMPKTHPLLKEEAKFSCRAIVLDLTAAADVDEALTLLEALEFELRPTTKVVALGPLLLAQRFLDDPRLANTVHSLYLSFNHFEPYSNSTDKEVLAYSRCHYCYDGEPKVLVLDQWSLTQGFYGGADLFPDQFKDCMGHKFRVVSMDWFPFLKFQRDSQEPATTVTPLDSLDVRMLNSIARVLNFTYEIRVPWDNQWGVRQDDGNWTGSVGTLQRQQADFSMLLNWSQERKNAIDFSRIYAAEPLVVVTSKPRLLPKYLSIVNPFTNGVWLGVVMMGVCGGLAHWVLQRLRQHLPGGQDLSCGSALFYTTGLLLEDPPFKLPTNMTGQVFVGFWCVFGMLLASMYRSSLVAHLSVPGREAPVESFTQLLAQEGWSWGLEPTYGAEWEWFQSSTTTTVRNIFRGIQILDLENHLEQILDHGRHALLTWKYHIQTVVASRHTDSRGYTPLYIGRTEYYVSTGYGWGFRKGAPFLPQLDKTKQRLIETGHINHWMNDLIQTSARMARREEGEKKHLQDKEQSQELEVAGMRAVLSMKHLQGAFLLLSLGYIAALFTLMREAVLVALNLWK